MLFSMKRLVVEAVMCIEVLLRKAYVGLLKKNADTNKKDGPAGKHLHKIIMKAPSRFPFLFMFTSPPFSEPTNQNSIFPSVFQLQIS